MRVVVTGGAGYVGSVIAQHLLAAGHEVIVLDNLSRGHQDSVPLEARFIRADISDFEQVISRADHIDAVIHCASYISVAESMEQPRLYWHNNAVKSLELLEGMNRLGIKKLVFSSTAAVYGNPASTEPLTESSPTVPTNVYGMTKLATDMAIQSYAMTQGFAATSLRYFNVAGAEGVQGERHTKETHIIPLALAAADTENTVFMLYGTDYSTADGTCIRDYIHISDLANAHLLALNKLEASKHTIYNLGNGRGFSNLELLRTVEEVTNKPLSIRNAPRRSGDPAVLITSNEKARQQLGWSPQSDRLEMIIADAWKFYKRQK